MMLTTLQTGGAERNIVQLVPHLRDLGVEVTVGTMTSAADSPLAADLAATRTRRVDFRGGRLADVWALERFVRFCRSERFDVIHAQDQYTIVSTALARPALGTPTVMTRHVLVEPADTRREAVRARCALVSARFGFDRVITVSDAVRVALERSGVRPERLRTVHNGIAIEAFEAAGSRRAEVRRSLGWGDDPIVLMVAVLRRGKGHDVLFSAVPTIRASVPNARFVLVGEGELGRELRSDAAPLGEAVEFLGERWDVPDLMAAADLIVLPSWAEALPNVLLEAGAAGRAAVSTDAGGAAEIVRDGETGYIVPIGAPEPLATRIVELLEHPDRRAEMGEAARARVRAEFTFAAQARRTVEIYEQVREGDIPPRP